MTVVAVVGAGGYVGGRLVAHLRDRGAEVRPLARRAASWLGPSTVEVDLLRATPSELDAALSDAEVVVHVAGHDEVVAAREPERALLETIAMSQRLGEAARRTGVRRLVYLSTVHVYGAQLAPGAVVTEETTPAPRAAYAVARLASEHILAGALDPTVELVAFRLTNSVGAPASPDVDRWSLLVNDLCLQLVRQGAMALRSAGTQWRDWVDLGDVCAAIASASLTAAVPVGTYNLGSGRSCTVRDVAGLVADAWEQATGTRPPLHVPAATEPNPAPYRVDGSRARAAGLALDTPLRASIDEVVRFGLAHREVLAGG